MNIKKCINPSEDLAIKKSKSRNIIHVADLMLLEQGFNIYDYLHRVDRRTNANDYFHRVDRRTYLMYQLCIAMFSDGPRKFSLEGRGYM